MTGKPPQGPGSEGPASPDEKPSMDSFRRVSADLYTETGDQTFKIDIVVNPGGKISVFHNKPFRGRLAWVEFDLKENRLEFVLEDGTLRDFGTPLPKEFVREMQNAHEVLMVLMDEKTMEPIGSQFFPLILHG